MSYYSSLETLLHLIAVQPDQPLKWGLIKLLGGVVLLFATYYFTVKMVWPMIQDRYMWNGITGVVLAILMGVIVFAMILGGAGFGLYWGVEGLTSVGKPIGIQVPTDNYYYHNGGYVDKPGLSDVMFGTVLNPVNRVDEIWLAEQGQVLFNGYEVTETSLSSKQKSRTTYVTTTVGDVTMTTPITTYYTEYTVRVGGHLHRDNLEMYVVTESGDFANSLLNTRNQSLYIRGNPSDGVVQIEEFGKALK